MSPQNHAELRRQLEAAQRDVARLAAENESLMDISNALTAEKRQAVERLEVAAQEGKRKTRIDGRHSLVLIALLSWLPDTVTAPSGMPPVLTLAWTFLSRFYPCA